VSGSSLPPHGRAARAVRGAGGTGAGGRGAGPRARARAAAPPEPRRHHRAAALPGGGAPARPEPKYLPLTLCTGVPADAARPRSARPQLPRVCCPARAGSPHERTPALQCAVAARRQAWRAVDRAYYDKSFNGQSWFRVRAPAGRACTRGSSRGCMDAAGCGAGCAARQPTSPRNGVTLRSGPRRGGPKRYSSSFFASAGKGRCGPRRAWACAAAVGPASQLTSMRLP